MSKLVETLSAKGPMLSGELAKLCGLKAGSKAISISKEINKLKITFIDNQRFCYLPHQYKSDLFFARLFPCIESFALYHNALLNFLISQCGFASDKFLEAASSATAIPIKTKRLHIDILNELSTSELILKAGDYYQIAPRYYKKSNIKIAKAIELSKEILLGDIASKLKNYGIASYLRGKSFGQVNGYYWDYSAPTYVRGLSPDFSQNKEAFIVVSIIYDATKKDVENYLRKLNSTTGFKSKMIPIIVAKYIKPEVFELLKKNKIIIIKIEEMFGKKYLELLEAIISSFVNIVGTLKSDPDAIAQIFKMVAKNEGRINNMKGTLFELLVSHYYYEVGSRYIEIKKDIDGRYTKSGKPKEIDILVDKEGKIHFIECKAINEKINGEIITKWMNEVIPDIREWALKIYPNNKLEFQYWSLSGFDDEAIRLLQKHNSSKYDIEYYDLEKMKILSANTPAFKNILLSYFC